jgi:predicted DCC family thiol-disulfide oxidoreductase YuxK
MDKIKVYYNGACPVCKAGIEDQQCRMAAQDVTNIEWLDVNANPSLVQEVGANLETVRERLHVRNVDGSINIGTDAFAVLLERTRGQRWVGRLLMLPILRQLSQVAYNVFARLLYLWNRACRRW